MTLTARSRAFDGGTALLTANFSSSLKWGGIESVTDLEGNPIPREDWTITSESGFDYSRPFDEQVPEPASLGLISLTIGLVLARSRATKKR
jgi:hypothetical protein